MTSLPTVLYVGGESRSGSTLLERLLGRCDRVVNVGELKFVWSRSLAGGWSCSCGEPFRACPFWTEVGERAFGGWDAVDLPSVLERERRVDRHRYLPLMLAPRLVPSFDARRRAHVAVLERLYRAIREVSGADVVVDTSKSPATAYLLRTIEGLDLRVVHAVRDSRGTAYSWSKLTRQPDRPGSTEAMPRFGALAAGVRWDAFNAVVALLRATHTPVLRVRYEDFAVRPRDEVERVLRFAGLEPAPRDLDWIDPDGVDLGRSHSVSGNPIRFATGPTKIRLDDAWRSEMPPLDRAVVTLVTWPVMAAYGYGRGALGRPVDGDGGRSERPTDAEGRAA